MTSRAVVYLIAAACFALLLWETRAKPRTGAEHYRTCQIKRDGTHPIFDPPRSAIVPCRDLDSWLGTQWDI